MGRLQLRRRLGLAVVLALGSVYLVTPGVQAQQPEVRADLDGRPINPARSSSYFCHDFDFPQIHCFSTPGRLEAAMAQPASASLQGGLAAAFGPNDYVTVYSSRPAMRARSPTCPRTTTSWPRSAGMTRSAHIGHGTTEKGPSIEHWFAGGSTKKFCCNQNVPSLPAGVDNSFSSVYQT